MWKFYISRKWNIVFFYIFFVIYRFIQNRFVFVIFSFFLHFFIMCTRARISVIHFFHKISKIFQCSLIAPESNHVFDFAKRMRVKKKSKSFLFLKVSNFWKTFFKCFYKRYSTHVYLYFMFFIKYMLAALVFPELVSCLVYRMFCIYMQFLTYLIFF